ncbi:MAG: DUF975 family protein [Clostridium sp.]|nr:DUF975 family protein [Clostridium sp.]
MNNINRGVVKLQAKEIIRGKVFPLFLVVLIVGALTRGSSVVGNINTISNNIKNSHSFSRSSDYDFDDYFGENFDDGFDFDYDNPIENFEFDAADSKAEIVPVSNTSNMMITRTGNIFGSLTLVNIVFMPLLVTMAGMFLSLVRRNREEAFQLGNELGALFKNAFNENYFKKLAAVFLRSLFSGLLAILLIVPGVIYWLSTYFTYEILSDNPNMNFNEAMQLSKKMVKGNRTELFVLELSFIGWYLLCIVTLGLASIYVAPYVYTTKALYYENFRLRALQEGRITEADFLSYNDRADAYRQQNASQFGNDNGNNYYSYANYNAGSDTNHYYYNPQAQGNANVYNAAPTAEQPQQAYNQSNETDFSYQVNTNENDYSAGQDNSVNEKPAEQTENSDNNTL